MGVDVSLYAVGTVTDDELAKANEFVVSRTWGFYDKYTNDEPGPLVRKRDGSIDFWTLTRYYGPGYERGPWPQIRGAIVALRAALPQCQVFYGGDTGGEERVTDGFIAEMDEWWLGPNGAAVAWMHLWHG